MMYLCSPPHCLMIGSEAVCISWTICSYYLECAKAKLSHKIRENNPWHWESIVVILRCSSLLDLCWNSFSLQVKKSFETLKLTALQVKPAVLHTVYMPRKTPSYPVYCTRWLYVLRWSNQCFFSSHGAKQKRRKFPWYVNFFNWSCSRKDPAPHRLQFHPTTFATSCKKTI